MAQLPDRDLADHLRQYQPSPGVEAEAVHLVASLLDDEPWARTRPLHVTGSALILHPPTRRVLLRWHQRQQAWLQVGGHADPGEHDPLAVALREGQEETGLDDLEPWPSGELRHIAVVPVPANDQEPAHQHADLRFFLATAHPEAARPEHPTAPLRWVSVDEAMALTSEANVKETIRRAALVLDPPE